MREIEKNFGRKQSDRAIIFIILWASISIGSVILTFLLANDARNLRVIITESDENLHDIDAASTEATATGAVIMQESRHPLLSHLSSEQLSKLRRYTPVQARCAQLQRPRQEPPRFSAGQHISQCTALIDVRQIASGSSVFLQFHTNVAGELIFFRLKFNLASTDGVEEVQAGLAGLLNFAHNSPELVSTLDNIGKKIQNWTPFVYFAGDFRIEFRREYSNSSRFNLTGNFIGRSLSPASMHPPSTRCARDCTRSAL